MHLSCEFRKPDPEEEDGEAYHENLTNGNGDLEDVEQLSAHDELVWTLLLRTYELGEFDSIVEHVLDNPGVYGDMLDLSGLDLRFGGDAGALRGNVSHYGAP